MILFGLNIKFQRELLGIDITKEEFIKFSLSLWDIKPETRKEIINAFPVPSPEELAYRIIKFYTYEGDLVLDPFIFVLKQGEKAYILTILKELMILLLNRQ